MKPDFPKRLLPAIASLLALALPAVIFLIVSALVFLSNTII